MQRLARMQYGLISRNILPFKKKKRKKNKVAILRTKLCGPVWAIDFQPNGRSRQESTFFFFIHFIHRLDMQVFWWSSQFYYLVWEWPVGDCEYTHKLLLLSIEPDKLMRAREMRTDFQYASVQYLYIIGTSYNYVYCSLW